MNEKAKEAARNIIELGLIDLEMWLGKELTGYNSLSNLTLCQIREKINNLQSSASEVYIQTKHLNNQN